MREPDVVPPERAGFALYALLAHAPRLAPAWYTWATSLRNDAASSLALRELMILRTAQLTGSKYEWTHHRPMAEDAGVALEQIEDLSRWEASGAYDDVERAALRLTEEIDRMSVSDETFSELLSQLPASEVLELVITAAMYQAYARVMQALQVDVEPEFERYLSHFDDD